MEGVDSLTRLESDHCNVVIVEVGKETEFENSIPLRHFLNRKFQSARTAEDAAFVFTSPDGSAAVAVRDNQRKYSPNPRVLAVATNDASVRRWLSAASARLNHGFGKAAFDGAFVAAYEAGNMFPSASELNAVTPNYELDSPDLLDLAISDKTVDPWLVDACPPDGTTCLLDYMSNCTPRRKPLSLRGFLHIQGQLLPKRAVAAPDKVIVFLSPGGTAAATVRRNQRKYYPGLRILALDCGSGEPIKANAGLRDLVMRWGKRHASLYPGFTPGGATNRDPVDKSGRAMPLDLARQVTLAVPRFAAGSVAALDATEAGGDSCGNNGSNVAISADTPEPRKSNDITKRGTQPSHLEPPDGTSLDSKSKRGTSLDRAAETILVARHEDTSL